MYFFGWLISKNLEFFFRRFQSTAWLKQWSVENHTTLTCLPPPQGSGEAEALGPGRRRMGVGNIDSPENWPYYMVIWTITWRLCAGSFFQEIWRFDSTSPKPASFFFFMTDPKMWLKDINLTATVGSAVDRIRELSLGGQYRPVRGGQISHRF